MDTSTKNTGVLAPGERAPIAERSFFHRCPSARDCCSDRGLKFLIGMQLSERLLVEPEADSSSSPQQRVEVLDNAKAVLITCVVCYHTAVVYSSADRPESTIPIVSGFLMMLKAVVMPCFCLISGHLSPSSYDERRVRALFQLFVVFLIFQLMNYVNLMLSFRLNGFPFDAWPVQLFHPATPVRALATHRAHAHAPPSRT